MFKLSITCLFMFLKWHISSYYILVINMYLIFFNKTNVTKVNHLLTYLHFHKLCKSSKFITRKVWVSELKSVLYIINSPGNSDRVKWLDLVSYKKNTLFFLNLCSNLSPIWKISLLLQDLKKHRLHRYKYQN